MAQLVLSIGSYLVHCHFQASKWILVSGLPLSMTESNLEYHFGMINGQLKELRVLLHKDDAATIEYDDENDAEVAIKTYNRRVYDNKTVTLQFTTRPENDPSGDNKLVCT